MFLDHKGKRLRGLLAEAKDRVAFFCDNLGSIPKESLSAYEWAFLLINLSMMDAWLYRKIVLGAWPIRFIPFSLLAFAFGPVTFQVAHAMIKKLRT